MHESMNGILLEAGALLKAQYFDAPQWEEKARRDLVSHTDRDIERLLVDRLRGAYPKDGFHGEEYGRAPGQSGGTWLIDPIDGTANFIMGKPYFAISLAREQAGKITAAWVYNPVSDELYHARKGKNGAFLNGNPIGASTTTDIRHALIAFGFSANMLAIQRYFDEWKPVFDNCAKGVGWITPALTLCNVARGRLDAYIDFGASSVGQAAGSYILQRAQGIAADYDDFDRYDHLSKGIVACGAGLLDALKEARTG